MASINSDVPQRRHSTDSTCSSDDEPCRTPRANINFMRASCILLLVAVITLVISCVVPRNVELDEHRFTAREYEAAQAHYTHRAHTMDVMLVVGLGVLCLACILLSAAHVEGFVRDIYRDPGRGETEVQGLTSTANSAGYGGMWGSWFGEDRIVHLVGIFWQFDTLSCLQSRDSVNVGRARRGLAEHIPERKRLI